MDLFAIKRPNGFQITGEVFEELFEKLSNGQTYKIKVTKSRNPNFHAKVLGMLRTAFDYWEPTSSQLPQGVDVVKDFDRFRKDLTIQAGFYEIVWLLNGKFILEAKSISFDSMEQTEFEELFNAYVDVILNSPNIVPKDELSAKAFRDLIVSYL